jgi:NitT/TauT family transport system permease protein
VEINGYRIPPSAALLVWAALWEIVGRADLTMLMPPLTHVLARLPEIVPTGTFAEALGITARAFASGSLIAIAVGVPMGVIMGRWAIADRILLPWVNVFVSAPLSALVPVIMALFGFGETTIMLTVLLFAMWIIVLDARAGARSIAPSLVEMARSYGATPLQAFSKIYIWAALPEILAGVRLGLVRAVKGVIIGQLLISVVGFGHLFEIYSSNFLMEHMWALLLVLFALAFVIDSAMGYLERRVEYYAATRH